MAEIAFGFALIFVESSEPNSAAFMGTIVKVLVAFFAIVHGLDKLLNELSEIRDVGGLLTQSEFNILKVGGFVLVVSLGAYLFAENQKIILEYWSGGVNGCVIGNHFEREIEGNPPCPMPRVEGRLCLIQRFIGRCFLFCYSIITKFVQLP